MNKSLLLKHILEKLEALHLGAINAAMQAYNTATHEENVAENKYDTLGLEAAYLAQGQSQRVTECEADFEEFKKLTAMTFSSDSAVDIGALVLLKDERGLSQHLFMGPAAGGLKLSFDQKSITMITPSAPLGAALRGHFVGDEIGLKVGGRERYYEIAAIY
jgi:transcription elongation GreA/GreB family factor